MAGKSRPSAEKRRIDKQRQERQAAKRERRHSREEGDAGSEGENTEELMERFRLLSEAHAAGRVTDEEFGPARHELMVALGVEDPVDEPEA